MYNNYYANFVGEVVGVEAVLRMVFPLQVVVVVVVEEEELIQGALGEQTGQQIMYHTIHQNSAVLEEVLPV